jgi:hypothetical protein
MFESPRWPDSGDLEVMFNLEPKPRVPVRRPVPKMRGLLGEKGSNSRE